MGPERIARSISQLLGELQIRLVLAESCTGGMASALLTQVPGISQYFCGSAVTYRPQTKSKWLGIPSEVISEFQAESREVTAEMAKLALLATPEAGIAGAITGDLGPGVDDDRDGVCYLAIASRKPSVSVVRAVVCQLATETRIQRQYEAALKLLELVASELKNRRG